MTLIPRRRAPNVALVLGEPSAFIAPDVSLVLAALDALPLCHLAPRSWVVGLEGDADRWLGGGVRRRDMVCAEGPASARP